ncbi:unnamed protein product [Merluccius merluccius]
MAPTNELLGRRPVDLFLLVWKQGMLQRTKYSRLRNDSLSSLDDRHLDTKGDPQALAPPLAPLPARGPHGETSTLRGFIPRISLLGGLGALTHKSGHRNTDRRADERAGSDADWTPGRASRCHGGSPSTLHCTTKRPVGLQGCSLRSQPGGLSHWKIPLPAEEGSGGGPENNVVHHHHHHHVEALPKAVSVVLGQSNLQFSGSSVILTVSTDSMSLTTVCPLQTVAHHSIQAISFASGGDPVWIPARSFKDSEVTEFTEGTEEGAYYNQIPGKAPPAGGVQDLRTSGEADQQDSLIREVCRSKPVPLYENWSVARGPAVPSGAEQPDCGPECGPLSQDLIEGEGWFHGRLGREQAEALLSCSGDFLVRESCSASGHYVLSGMEGHTVKHLLLLHPNGQVRTCDQVFQSVGHLVRFHMGSRTPIVSGCSELSLTQPILHTF